MQPLLETGVVTAGLLVAAALFSSVHAINAMRAIHVFLQHHPILRLMLGVIVTSPLGLSLFSQVWETVGTNPWLTAFMALAIFKGLKIIIHAISFCFFTKPAQTPLQPTLSPLDVTVVVPTVGTLNDEFQKCIKSILSSGPAQVIVSIVGLENLKQVTEFCQKINKDKIIVVAVEDSNKRAQLLRGAREVYTKITAYADDTVFWPPTFLRSALAPMEDTHVGLVGTVKRVRRDRSGSLLASILNYIGCVYLERHNFECTASYNIDGGVFVISGRTALARTSIIQSREFCDGFLNETFSSPFQTVGPLKVDDDNFITRFMVSNGWKTVFHNKEDALMETVLGDKGTKKFHGQLQRWVRTTWRSNSTSLFVDRVCWRSQPWTTYAMFISSFVNFALFYDTALFFTLVRSGNGDMWWVLAFILLITKIIKPMPHLLREPRDWLFLPFGILFGYVHSIYKLYALFTASNIEWCGRQGIKAFG